jgi:hypothetical protein
VLDPAAWFVAKRIAVQAGMTIVGIIHSHPDAPARPSTHDSASGDSLGRDIVFNSYNHQKRNHRTDRLAMEWLCVSRNTRAMELTAHEQQRYARHISLPEVGATGQLRLKNARVLIVGAGGLGSPVALYLAAAGVGHIGIVDDDVVDLTNLQRQIIHADAAIGQPKVVSAQARMQASTPVSL